MAGSVSRAWQLAAIGTILAGALLTVPWRHLWDPDEARYAEVTREMLASRQMLVPLLYGEPYPHKPPLFFWAQAGLRACGLPWTAAAVLPSVVAVLAIVLLLPRLAAALGIGRDTGYLAGALLVSSPLAAGFGLAGRMDILLTLFHTLALFLLARLTGFGGPPRREGGLHLALWTVLALGVLTKGPVALALPLLAALAFRLVAGRQVALGPVFGGAGPFLFLVIVLAWLIPAGVLGGGEYFNDILVRQTADRVGSGSYTHPQPFYFHLVTYPLTGLPWSPVVIVATYHALHRRESGPLFLATAIVSLVMMFSLVSGKLVLYLLPMFPIAALLAAHHLLRDGPGCRTSLLIGSAASLLGGAALAIAPHWFPHLDGSRWLAFVGGVAVALPAAVAVGAALRSSRRGPAHGALIVAGLAFVAVSFPAAVRLLDPFMSVSRIATTVAVLEPGASDGVIYKDRYPGLALYSGRQITVLETPDELRAALAHGRWVVVRERVWRKLPADIAASTSEVRAIPHRRRTILLVKGKGHFSAAPPPG